MAPGTKTTPSARKRQAMPNKSVKKAISDLEKLSFKPKLPANMQPKQRKSKVPRNFGLSPALNGFVSAIGDPFAPSALGCYLPTLPGRNTYKTYGENRFEATIGTAGMGFVLISPTTANDSVAGFYTNGTYTLNTISPFASALATAGVLNAGVSTITMPLPYTTNDLAHLTLAEIGTPNSVYGRVVAVGARIFYIGNTSDEAGMVYCFVDPDHGDLTNLSLADLGKRRECEITLNGRDQCILVGAPISVAETEFYNNTAALAAQATQTTATHFSGVAGAVFPWSSSAIPDALGGTVAPVRTVGGAYVGISPMVIAFTGTAGKQVHVELIYHCEYEGKLSEGSATPSMVDTTGTLRCLAGINKAYAIKSAERGSFSASFAKAMSQCM